MYKHLKAIVIALALVIVAAGVAIPVLASAANDAPVSQSEAMQTESTDLTEENDAAEITAASDTDADAKSSKALASAIVVAIAAGLGALAMGIAISKSVEGVARQPEASGKIQTMLMLGLVFIETAIIYALIVAILIIFVL